jgi:hypothetical protein
VNFEKVSTKYLVTVPLEDFDALLEFESPWQDACRADETLYSKLRDMGVESDYDGHYSSAISVEIDEEDDGDEFRAEIATIIAEQLKTAAEWKNLIDNEDESD